MILNLIGEVIGFIGSFALIIETIYGNSIRPHIYQFVLKGVHEINLDHSITKIKLSGKEIRFLIWIFLIITGLALEIIEFFII